MLSSIKTARMVQSFRFAQVLGVASSLFLLLAAFACKHSVSAGEFKKPANPIQAALLECDYAKALSLAEAGANAGSVEAEFYLGRIYNLGWYNDANGKQVRSGNQAEAKAHYLKAAAGGNARAKVFLARFEAHSWFDPGNFSTTFNAKGLSLLNEAAGQGDLQAKYLLLMTQEKHQERPTPEQEANLVAAWRNSADQGDPYASSLLAAYYGGDDRVKRARDPKLLLKYLQIQAASEADFNGGSAAGFLFTHGAELGADPDKTGKLIDRYLESGAEDMRLTYEGQCITKPSYPLCDPVKVIKYNGDDSDRSRMHLVSKEYLSSLPPDKVQEGLKEAREWKQKPMLITSPDYLVLTYVPYWLEHQIAI